MEGGVIHDGHMRVVELRAELLFHPGIEDGGVGGALKEHRGIECLADACGDQAGARSAIARARAVDLLAFRCPAMRALGGWGKAAFIHIHKLLARCVVFVPALQVAFPNFWIILSLQI